jgi:CheY-like chemotaxis protein
MNGRIWAESVAGHGTRFIFTAWFDLAHSVPVKRQLLPQALNGLRALVADDNPAAREILMGMLSTIPFDVDAVGSGAEAVAAVKAAAGTARAYDVVFMDWKMPGMNGVDATRLIKSDASLAKMPAVVMVTAFGLEEVRTDFWSSQSTSRLWSMVCWRFLAMPKVKPLPVLWRVRRSSFRVCMSCWWRTTTSTSRLPLSCFIVWVFR